MKILVVSLLRLGDLIQQSPLLKGLRQQFPQAQIHLLMNQQFASAEEVLEGLVDKYIYLDRESLQKGMGEASYNMFWSYQQLATLVQQLNGEHYDVAYNFTHNKLSAFLLGAIQASEKKGLYHSENHFHGLENRWLKYFNDRFSGTHKSLFHYIELLGNSFSIPVQKNPEGQSSLPAAKTKTILLQPLTSDEKKNWGLQRFADLKRMLEAALPDHPVKVLAAAFERERLLQYFDEKDLLVTSLSEVGRELRQATLLVTGDTSIKHLAAQNQIPIVEIAIGSSDPNKTAAFTMKSTILRSSVGCAPCSHSSHCFQKSHLCAEDISVENVFAAVWDQLAHATSKGVDAIQELERVVWGLYLDADMRPQNYAKSAKHLQQYLGAEKIKIAQAAWQSHTELYKNWLARAQASLPEKSIMQMRRHFQATDISQMILLAQEILKSGQDEAGYFQGLVEALLSRFALPIQMHEKIQLAINEARDLVGIRETLTSYLQTHSMEGEFYAKGIGQLPIEGFAEAGTGRTRDSEDAEL